MGAITKDSQLKYRGRKKKLNTVVESVQSYKNEAELQQLTNDILAVFGVHSWRIPDTTNADHIRRALCGMADNVVQIPIEGTRWCLSCNVELKTHKGKLHGRQKTLAKQLNYQICREPDEVVQLITDMKDYVRNLERTGNWSREGCAGC